MSDSKKIRVKEEVLNRLISIGQQMSNVCYNLSHGSGITEDNKTIMAQLVREWDATNTHLSSTKTR